MSSTPLNQNGDCIDHIPDEEVLSSGNAESGEANFVHIDDDTFGEPEVSPRIGDEYQAELPPLNGEPNRMFDSEDEQRSAVPFMIGFSMPLTEIKCQKHEGLEAFSDSVHQTCCVDDHVLVPRIPGESWSDAEKSSFLLALYIFEKNFIEVRRFIETKDMGAVLAFYYGDFRRSTEYKRWSKGRKSSKKSVRGEKIFSGLRKQELLSRLMQRVPEEFQSAVLEVFTNFGEDKMLFKDFISTLKALVGMHTLVEAVGIGKGKQDITEMVLKRPKANQMTRARPEIPARKACSSLTTTEIIKCVSGDYRLSKARSNELFWEAVWPRLLARGWHSEQPHNLGYIGGSKLMVFLMPGIKEFSRRKLVKGHDYFDSITDVLSKVAKEPELIELEDEVNQKDEAKMENDQPAKQHHFYLQPRTSNQSSDAIKFTIVDTSLSDGNVRELRTLPSQDSNTIISDGPHEDDEADDTTDIPTIIVDVSPAADALLISKADGESSMSKPQKVTKTLSRKQNQDNADNIAPTSKRCKRLTSGGNGETRDGVIHPSTTPTLKKRTSHCSSDFHESSVSPCESIKPSQRQLLIDLNWPAPEFKPSQPQLLIDLNLPSSEAKNEEQAVVDTQRVLIDTIATNEPDEQAVKQENQTSPSSKAKNEEQGVLNTRRLSTRYRSPTSKAIEAVASGLLSVPQKRKGKDASSSRPSQLPRRGVSPTDSPSSPVASHVEEAERGASSSATTNTLDNSHNPPEAKDKAG